MQNKTKRLTESAMLLAMAIVLELVSKMFIPGLPFGGQITICSMLPVVLISYRHGVRWGLASSAVYALIEMAIGSKNVVAFTVLGLGGCFRNRIQNPGAALALGSVVALSARFASHIASGYILFSGWAEWFFTQEGFPAWGAALVEKLSPEMLGLAYSVVYNAMNMVPEIILTAIVAFLIAKVPKIVVKVS